MEEIENIENQNIEYIFENDSVVKGIQGGSVKRSRMKILNNFSFNEILEAGDKYDNYEK
jgi:hypothetical protein